MWIPGFGSDELRPFKKQATTEAHKQVSTRKSSRILAILSLKGARSRYHVLSTVFCDVQNYFQREGNHKIIVW